MPGDAFKKVLAGQPFAMPADFYNALVDATKRDKSARETSATGATAVRSTTIVRVKNNSGEDRARFEIMGIDEPIIGPAANLQQFQSEVALTGVTPVLPDHLGKFVILLEPTPAGRTGRAFVSGVCPVKLNSGNPDDSFAEIIDEECGALQPCPLGSAQILWRDTDSNWAVVRLGNKIPRPYALHDCRREKPTLIVVNDLRDDVDRVVKVDGTCYEVRLATCDELRCCEPKCVKIEGRYENCSKCRSCWKLTRCDDEETTRTTNTDLAEYEGRVVKLDDGYCYEVEQADDCYDAEPVTVVTNYSDCSPCGHCYTLQACHDETLVIKVTNDLAEFSGFTSEELVDDQRVFEIEGTCYFVTAYDTECYDATEREITDHYTECDQCGCYELTECDADPPEVLQVHAAEDEDGGHVNLEDHVGEVVRLAGGKAYTVAKTTDCEGATSVTVLEAYDTCEDAKCYELSLCGETETIVTFADLASYETGTVLKSGDQCYTLVGEHAWTEDAVPFTVDAEFPDCDTCLGNTKYRLKPSCTNSGCGEGGDSGSPPEIITTEPLHDAVGQYVKVDGHCYEVEEVEEGDVSDETLDYEGPFVTCEECQSSPVTTRKPRITRIYIEGDQIKADVEEDIIENGLIVGFCGGGSQTIGKYCCDEDPSSGGNSSGSGS